MSFRGIICVLSDVIDFFLMGTKLIIPYSFFVCKTVGRFVGIGKFTVSKLTLKG